MLDRARKIDRDELIAEWRRLHLIDRANERTLTRLAVACIALCSARDESRALYHSTGCDLLELGSILYGPMTEAGEPFIALLGEAQDAMRTAADAVDAERRKRSQEALQAQRDAAALRAAEEDAGAPLLPVDFRLGQWSLMDLARASMAMPGDVRIMAARQVFSAAIMAHRAGELGEWMDAHPDAGAIWPGRV